MNAKRINKVTFSLNEAKQTKLKAFAKQKGLSASKLVGDLIDKYLIGGEEIVVILRIPANLRNNEDTLRKWLNVKTEAIVKTICS